MRRAGPAAGEARIDGALRSLRERPAPAPSAALEALVAETHPVVRRRPVRVLALVVLGSLAVLTAHLHAVGIRRDLAALPSWWFWSMTVAWFAAYLAPLAIALVPRRGSMLVSSRVAQAVAVGIPVVALGMAVLVRIDAPPATVIPETPAQAIARAEWCLVTGLEMGAVPFALGVLALRRAPHPVETRWIGAALGAACGTLSALVLHVHCWIGGAFHTGVSHAGQAVLGGIVGALLVPWLTARNRTSLDA